MPKLPDSLSAWNSDRFSSTLKSEIENLETGTLPLMQGVSQGSVTDDRDISVSVLSVTGQQNSIQAKVGVFFTEILAGCSCGDEPMSMNAYCEVMVSIDKSTAETEFAVLQI